MTRSEKIGRLIVILTAVLWTTNAAAAWLVLSRPVLWMFVPVTAAELLLCGFPWMRLVAGAAYTLSAIGGLWLLCTATFPSGPVWVLFAAMLAADTAAACLMWFYKGVREYLYVRQNG